MHLNWCEHMVAVMRSHGIVSFDALIQLFYELLFIGEYGTQVKFIFEDPVDSFCHSIIVGATRLSDTNIYVLDVYKRQI